MGPWTWTQGNTDQLIGLVLALPFCVLMPWLASFPQSLLGKITVLIVTAVAALVIVYFLLTLILGG